jgi:AGZA family xanthine/uracil permease-like MFS transporter
MTGMKRFFDFEGHQTNYRREIVAGCATFLTMAYIMVVNPAILEAAGIPKGPSMTVTILTAVFGTALVGVYARRPFAIAPYMGENAFIAFTVVKGMGLSWQVALGAIFLAGVLFTVLTLIKVRAWMANAIPLSLKCSFAVGIGLFLTFIGLNDTGMVTVGVKGAPVALGALSSRETLLAIAGFLLIAWLLVRRVRGVILIGILAITAMSILLGITPAPRNWVALPPSPRPLLGQLDIAGALSPQGLPVVAIVFVMAFVDTVGTLIGLSSRAGLLNERGDLPEIEKPMLADALSNLAAPLMGTTTSGVYIESAVGIEEGGRTGFTALVVAGLFAVSLFCVPLLTVVPPHAYGTALVAIGIFMIAPVTRIDFQDYTELIPAFLTIVLTCFTFNIGVGVTAGLITHPVIKTLAGRARETGMAQWTLAALSLVFYLCYPYSRG